jgi:hypothetical protein
MTGGSLAISGLGILRQDRQLAQELITTQLFQRLYLDDRPILVSA